MAGRDVGDAGRGRVGDTARADNGRRRDGAGGARSLRFPTTPADHNNTDTPRQPLFSSTGTRRCHYSRVSSALAVVDVTRLCHGVFFFYERILVSRSRFPPRFFLLSHRFTALIMNNESVEYDVGDLVWAKMKGFPPWPGKVTAPADNMKKANRKHSRWIFFFGTNNFAWIEVGCLKPYFTFKDTLTYGCKSTNFKDACKAIDEHIAKYGTVVKKNGISESDTRFDSLIESDSSSSVANKKKVSNAARPSSTTVDKPAKKRPVSSLTSKTKKIRISSNNTDILTNVGLVNNHSTPVRKNNTLLDRPEVSKLEIVPLDVSKISESLMNKNVEASHLIFGLIGLGNIGSGIAKNLINSGHKVVIWNRSTDKVEKFNEAGALPMLTPADVVGTADVTLSCVTDPQVVKDMVYGNCGILSEMRHGKSYIEMSGIDHDTSQDINDSVIAKGGRYLEAMIQGSKNEAEEGSLVLLTGGDKSLFDECESAFSAIAKNSFFLGEIGIATKMSMILHSIKAITLAGLAEGMALADRAGISQKDLIEILGLTSLRSTLIMEKGKAMMENHFQTNQALKLLQKDVYMTMQWSESLEQPCPLNATVNEVFKHAKRLGYSDHDTSSVYVRAKF